MFTDADRRLEPVLRDQQWAFTRQQALAAGFTAHVIQHRLASGPWRRIAPGLYAHHSAPASWLKSCHGAVLLSPTGALGGLSSLALHGLPGFAQRGTAELTVPPGTRHANPLAAVRRSRFLQRHRRHGLPVQSIPLALLEVAGRIPSRRLDRAFEDAVLLGLTSVQAVTAWYDRIDGSPVPGIAELRRTIFGRDLGDPPPASELEAGLYDLLDDDRIPPFVPQARFPWRGDDDRRRCDAYLEAWQMIVEADGRRWHARLETMAADRARDLEAARHGVLTLRLGWIDVMLHRRSAIETVVEAGAHRVPRAA